MTPIGPYKHTLNMACDRFIVSDWRNGQEVVLIVNQGQPRTEGVLVPSVRDAKWQMNREGFALNTNKVQS